MDIKHLSTTTKNQICSNQVIVSIVDAVKELLENSLDASSSRIDIKLKNYGIDFIEVIDDGSGILEHEFELLAKRHATSKILEFDDLELTKTFGYRGEALHSLCYSGNVEIHSRHRTSELGTRVKFNQHGQIESKKSQAREIGTTVRISRLFERLPIRRQQLMKNYRSELTKIQTLVVGFMIGSEKASISLQHGLTDKFNILVSCQYCRESESNSDWLKRNTESLLGLDSSIDKQMIGLNLNWDNLEESLIKEMENEFHVSSDTLKSYDLNIRGWIQRPLSQMTRVQHQYLLINRRPSDSKELSKLIKETYKSILPGITKSPTYIVILNLSSNLIDVNLNPDKRTVLFRHVNSVKALLKLTIVSSLQQAGISTTCQPIGPASTTPFNTHSPPRKIAKLDSPAAVNRTFSKSRFNNDSMTLKYDSSDLKSRWNRQKINWSINNQSEVLGLEIKQLENELTPKSRTMNCIQSDLAKCYVIGQFNKGFILCLQSNSLIIVDQHAADERFRLEKLQRACFNNSNSSDNSLSGLLKIQPLIQPELIVVNYDEFETANQHQELLKKFGYRFQLVNDEIIGKMKISLEAVPFRDKLTLDSNDFLDLIHQLSTVSLPTDLSNKDCLANVIMSSVPKLANVLASNACRSAIMIGSDLSREQMKQVLVNLTGLKYPWICAHGRPTLRYLCDVNRKDV